MSDKNLTGGGIMEKKQCFCGCSSFDVYQWDKRKGDIILKCQACKCERRINSPGVSADKYELLPELVKAVV